MQSHGLAAVVSSALLLLAACGGQASTDEPSGGTGGAPSQVSLELTNTVVYSDCTLGERGDTIVASWTASISGAIGRDTATLTGATLTVVGARTQLALRAGRLLLLLRKGWDRLCCLGVAAGCSGHAGFECRTRAGGS